MKSCLDGWLVEIFVDTVHILADDSWLHDRNFSVGKSNMFFAIWIIDLLIEAFGVEVEHAGVSGIEFSIHNFSDLLARFRVIAKNTCSCDLHVLIFCIVSMIV